MCRRTQRESTPLFALLSKSDFRGSVSASWERFLHLKASRNKKISIDPIHNQINMQIQQHRSHSNPLLFIPEGPSSPQLSSILLNKVHLCLSVIIPDKPASIFPELKLLRCILVIFRPLRKSKTLSVGIQLVGEGDERAHDVQAVLADRRWNGAERIQDDV